jgi:hypothetical protein
MQLRPLALGMMTAASLLFFACHHEESSGAPAQLQAASTPGAHACPMSVTGASVTASDVPTGVVLEFATGAGPNEVAELQRRVHAMSDSGTLGLMRGPGGGGGRGGRALAREGAAAARPRSRVEDTAKGARVTLEPADAQGLDALRTRARAHAQHMANNNGCMQARTSP